MCYEGIFFCKNTVILIVLSKSKFESFQKSSEPWELVDYSSLKFTYLSSSPLHHLPPSPPLHSLLHTLHLSLPVLPLLHLLHLHPRLHIPLHIPPLHFSRLPTLHSQLQRLLLILQHHLLILLHLHFPILQYLHLLLPYLHLFVLHLQFHHQLCSIPCFFC
uniref:Uncharacterized protein n=1 Tax=Cacopsylla melanoneura TaxID=428564 RepID=A0A8D8RMW8_9HEMI